MKKNKTALITVIICVPILVLIVSLIIIISKITAKSNAQGAIVSATNGTEYVSLFLGLELEDEEQIDYYHDFYKTITAKDDYATDLDTDDTGYSITLTKGKTEQTYSVVIDTSTRYESVPENTTPNYLIYTEIDGEERYYSPSAKKIQKLLGQIRKDIEKASDSDIYNDPDSVIWNTDLLEENSYNGYPKNQIVIIDDYTNYAWGVCIYGSFIDLSGNYYTYDLSDHNLWGEAMEAHPDEDMNMDIYYDYFYELLYNDFYLTHDPIGYVDVDRVREIYCEGLFLPGELEYDEKSMACDAGQKTLYFYKGHKNYKLYSNGDWEVTAKGALAKDMIKAIQKLHMIEY